MRGDPLPWPCSAIRLHALSTTIVDTVDERLTGHSPSGIGVIARATASNTQAVLTHKILRIVIGAFPTHRRPMSANATPATLVDVFGSGNTINPRLAVSPGPRIADRGMRASDSNRGQRPTRLVNAVQGEQVCAAQDNPRRARLPASAPRDQRRRLSIHADFELRVAGILRGPRQRCTSRGTRGDNDVRGIGRQRAAGPHPRLDRALAQKHAVCIELKPVGFPGLGLRVRVVARQPRRQPRPGHVFSLHPHFGAAGGARPPGRLYRSQLPRRHDEHGRGHADRALNSGLVDLDVAWLAVGWRRPGGTATIHIRALSLNANGERDVLRAEREHLDVHSFHECGVWGAREDANRGSLGGVEPLDSDICRHIPAAEAPGQVIDAIEANDRAYIRRSRCCRRGNQRIEARAKGLRLGQARCQYGHSAAQPDEP